MLETMQHNAETRCNGQRGRSGARDKWKSREDDEARDGLHGLRCGAPPKRCTAAGGQEAPPTLLSPNIDKPLVSRQLPRVLVP